MSEDRISGQNRVKPGWMGVRPVFLIAGAIALVGFGAIFGATLDLAMRTEKPADFARPAQVHPPREVPPPRIEVQAGVAPETASILQRTPISTPKSRPPATKEPEQQPLALNEVSPPPASGRSVIAVVIDDMGLDRARALKMIELNGPLTLSLMTYADGIQSLSDQAHKRGHEVMAHLPMEPIDPKENPGPGALKVDMDEATIRRVMAADLDGWSGYMGVNNHMGSRFTQDSVRMAIVMNELKARGLLWLDSKTIGASSGPAVAKAADVPFVERDVFIDNTETVEAVTKQLELLVTTAKAHGTAIGIGHPHDATRNALQQWLPSLEARGITLVPVTEIYRRRSARNTPG